jgi:flagellar biosynthesis protein FlhB
MADTSGQRSEKATPRRLDRARKEGNFPSSKEFVASVQFLGFVALMALYAASGMARAGRLMRTLLQRAFTTDVSPASVGHLAIQVIAPELFPLMLGGGALVLLVLAVQMGVTKLGLSLKKLTPDFTRLNPMKRLASMPSQNLFMTGQAILLLALVTAVVYYEVAENLNTFLELPWLAPRTAVARVGGVLGTLLWRAAGLFLLVGVIDLLWQRSRYNKQLRMSKQEIREEVKEQESSPHVKMRIRRIQRDLARRHMMKEIATATAVIVNPTHYAVAIRYSIDSSAAPRVVAKGKNYLAQRIRKRALEHQVPIVENPPLARALYASVEVGQEIPGHLYRAVAEILAYLYRLMNGRLPGS